MAKRLNRRTLIAGASAAAVGLASPALAAAQSTAYAAFRLVRGRAGDPSVPEITLPDGYTIVEGERYSVASRAEYYTFVEGPPTDGVDVVVRWPGVRVSAVVAHESRLKLERDPFDSFAFRFRLPVTRSSINANQPTIQVWSHPDISPGMYWRIEHNHPDRAAGPWTTVPWPAGQVKSVIHQLVAAHDIWTDSGMVATAAAKGHRFVLMGFETNNTLHADNPPHWHISYNSGPDFGSPTHNPHFWFDSDGRNYYNGMDVSGLGRLRYYVGDPAPIYDFIGDANDGRGDLVVTITIREDGGLDVTSAEGRTYAIAAGRDGSLRDEVTVLRDGQPWKRIATSDDVDHGVLVVRRYGLTDGSESVATVMRYDHLTGVLI